MVLVGTRIFIMKIRKVRGKINKINKNLMDLNLSWNYWD